MCFKINRAYYAFKTSTVCNPERASQRRMTDESSTEQRSVVMTTVDDVTGTAAATVVTSYSSGIEFYFQCAVVVIGVVGTAANGLILYAMVASKQHKKQVLIFNQNILDLFSSFFLVITYALKLCNIHLTGSAGYWFCLWVISENLIWIAVMASKANLYFITIERYLKVVYPIWSKKTLRKWMTHLAVALAWISGVVHICILTFMTSDVVDGVCYGYVIWKSHVSQSAYGIFYFLAYYAIILLVFIFCYCRILIAIRRQASVMAGHGGGPGPHAAQAQSSQIQSSIIKTMILVSAFYTVSDLPMNIYYLMVNVHALQVTLLNTGYYAAMFVSFFYFCTNPFIYAAKFDPVKRILPQFHETRTNCWMKTPCAFVTRKNGQLFVPVDT